MPKHTKNTKPETKDPKVVKTKKINIVEQEVAVEKMVEEAGFTTESTPKETIDEKVTLAELSDKNSTPEEILEDDYAPIKAETKKSDSKKKEVVKEDYLYEKEEGKSNNIILKTIFLVAALALIGYFVIWGGSGGAKTNTPNNKPSESAVDKKPCLNNNQKMDIPQNLKIEDTLVGTGKEVFSRCQIKIHYKGTLLPAEGETEGKVFDSSYNRGTPFSTQIGVGKLIKGWDIGIIGMKEGGKRKLTIPAELAYGDIELPGIPAKSTLVFEVELIQVLD
jgi:FKBP-type peptidyl-prolyl cis-trans isomerase